MAGNCSAGDKDVFFRILHQRLSAQPEWLEALRSQVGESLAVSNDLSRILRGSKEIVSLVKQCDEDDIIGILFDGNDLRVLGDIMGYHFNEDGTAKIKAPSLKKA